MRKSHVRSWAVSASVGAALLGAAAWVDSLAAAALQAPVDYYYANGQKVKLTILKDRIGVVAARAFNRRR